MEKLMKTLHFAWFLMLLIEIAVCGKTYLVETKDDDSNSGYKPVELSPNHENATAQGHDYQVYPDYYIYYDNYSDDSDESKNGTIIKRKKMKKGEKGLKRKLKNKNIN